jgi:flagellar biosynthetic protein FliP
MRRLAATTWLVVLAVTAVAAGGAPAAPSAAATRPATATQPAGAADVMKLLPDVDTPAGMSATLRWIVVITVMSLAPAILVMVTCFTRIVVVLNLLRQALAAQQVPPNHVLLGLAVLMTVTVMAPVYQDVYRDAAQPYFDGRLDRTSAVAAGEKHVRKFMIRQIESGGNTDDVYLFLDDEAAGRGDLTWGDVPSLSLVPAFVVSELKIAFFMGFRIYLPFLVIDMLVGAVLISMGMFMLPPVLISLPFKLLLFVLADGWHLVVGTLMQSFG